MPEPNPELFRSVPDVVVFASNGAHGDGEMMSHNQHPIADLHSCGEGMVITLTWINLSGCVAQEIARLSDKIESDESRAQTAAGVFCGTG